MSLNPLTEARYRYRLAVEHIERAERLLSLRDWVGAVSSSQLATENFAKTIVALFEVPTWSHDPSNQLKALMKKLPRETAGGIKELATLTSKGAAEHGRSSYGEPSAGLVPSDIYREPHALEALANSKKARKIAEKTLSLMNIKL